MGRVEVTVVCFGSFRERLPDPASNTAVVQIDEGETVSDVARALGVDSSLLHAVLVDGVRAHPSTSLRDGAEVTLMPAFSGGAAIQEERR